MILNQNRRHKNFYSYIIGFYEIIKYGREKRGKIKVSKIKAWFMLYTMPLFYLIHF